MDDAISFREDDFTLGRAGLRARRTGWVQALAKKLITLIGCLKIRANLWGGVQEQMPNKKPKCFNIKNS